MKYTTIKEHHLFDKTFRKGTRATEQHLTVFLLPDLKAKKLQKENPLKKKYNRLGISVTKKTGGAVQRNRVKRILRTGYRALEPELQTGYLVVITPRAGILDLKSTDVEKELRHAFQRLHFFLQKES